MKFKVQIQRPILPPNHVPGAPLPERMCIEVTEYFTDAHDRTSVVEQLHAWQAAGIERFKGRTIRDIAPVLNGREPGVTES